MMGNLHTGILVRGGLPNGGLQNLQKLHDSDLNKLWRIHNMYNMDMHRTPGYVVLELLLSTIRIEATNYTYY
jgi:hypothetical protein